MNMSDLASDHLKTIRNQIKGAVHGGLHLSSEDTANFARRLTTVMELVRETEEENRVLKHAMAVQRDTLRNRRAAGAEDVPAKVVALLPRRPAPDEGSSAR